MASLSHGRHGAQGLVELAIVTPGVLLGLMILLGLGLVLRADGGVAAVAVEAARAAALASDASSAGRAAQTQATSVADGYGLSNGSLKVGVDTSRFSRGGDVGVIATYMLPVGQLPLLGWQAITLRHEAFAPIDPNRTFR